MGAQIHAHEYALTRTHTHAGRLTDWTVTCVEAAGGRGAGAGVRVDVVCLCTVSVEIYVQSVLNQTCIPSLTQHTHGRTHNTHTGVHTHGSRTMEHTRACTQTCVHKHMHTHNTHTAHMHASRNRAHQHACAHTPSTYCPWR